MARSHLNEVFIPRKSSNRVIKYFWNTSIGNTVPNLNKGGKIMKKDLNQTNRYDLCELIKSRYDESTGIIDVPVDANEVTVCNQRDGGISITLQRGEKLLKKPLLKFKGQTLYLWDCFPIPAQAVFESSKKMWTRYRDISITIS